MGMLHLYNRGTEPVTVEQVETWDGGLGTALGDVVFVTRAAGDAEPVGGTSTSGELDIRERAAGLPGWSEVAPLAGAELPPCCDPQIIVGLEVRTDAEAPSGTFRGVTITYRTSDGRRFQTNAPTTTGFCDGLPSTPRCEAAYESAEEQGDVDVAPLPSFEDVNVEGSWDG